MTRSCDGCTECCTVLEVRTAGFIKPAKEACHFVSTCGKGCRIYDHRPAQCASYRCVWLTDSEIPDDLKPEHSGLIFDLAPTAFGPALCIRETRPDVWNGEINPTRTRLRNEAYKIAKRHNAFFWIVYFDGREEKRAMPWTPRAGLAIQALTTRKGIKDGQSRINTGNAQGSPSA